MLLYPCGHSCWLPFVDKQLNKFVISRILYPAEDITKILYRIQFVISDIGEDGHEKGHIATSHHEGHKLVHHVGHLADLLAQVPVQALDLSAKV